MIQVSTDVVGVLCMFYLRQNSVVILYFASDMMRVVGTDDIGALEMEI